MTIVYAVIFRSKDASVLVEQCCNEELKSGNVHQVTLELLTQLRDTPDSISDGELKTFVHKNGNTSGGLEGCNGGIEETLSNFIESCNYYTNMDTYSTHFFHVLLKFDVFYCCLSDDPDIRYQKVNYAFLHHIQDQFTKENSYRKIMSTNTAALSKSFSRTMIASLHHYNTNYHSLSQDDRVANLMAQVQDMKDIMSNNIVLLYNRGQSLQDMVTLSDEMKHDIQIFNKKARQHKIQNQQKNFNIYFVAVFAAVLLVYFMLSFACGFTFGRCRIS